MIDRICIIGVGLIGGSFVAGLKQTNQVKTVIGFSRQESHLRKAQEMGIIDEYSLDISQVLKQVQMVIIATPVNSFQAILEMIKPHIDESVIISDVGSTKGSVIQIAKLVFGQMPAKFIPAHPIAGKEKSGIEAVDAQLFNHKRVVLTPTESSDIQTIAILSGLWKELGAKVEIMTDKKHDDLLAMTSHLPHMLAYGLMDYLISNNPYACRYVAGGFKDFSRIASSDALMWRDICINNPKEIVKHIEGYQKTLEKISNLIKNNKAEALEQLFQEAKSARDNWFSS
ncbi:prephenate dehydrogenase [Candidatus Vesicomyidisocius calyptogenae]|uniref:prephenate dehydrogenase n=1 Tax=Vesicomyosocius okutanii subsp. Calyptogena okutanii (strain HA) TaxID=412965 RepID=A5CWH6_VESOH|nr:prephenate dehydrogenase/arogenate dehydrogenase family protein [Candidatus Vesicomyosocius okutanii]BAF61693.1 prephenate dehydrogenase [Candidatus Vesicomyosocius okutanii]